MKIALIEDRVKRQKDFLDKNNINLDAYFDVIDNFIEEKANNLLEDIINNTFDLSKYEIIICHKSIEYDDKNSLVISTLKKYCKLNKKTLVLFSGGISVNYYDNSEFEYLELNSNTLYSQNLQFFLDAIKNQKENVLMLSYGKDWDVNIVSSILEKTNIFISKQTENDIEISSLYQYIDMSKLSKINYTFYDMNIENGWVYLDEIKLFYDSLMKFCDNTFEISEKSYSSILIHNNNIVDLTLFQNRIRFTTNEDIDEYISNYIINELKEKDFDRIFIKDNLSPNYLELYGLRVVYHIRLSDELGDKKFVPIIIISDLNSEILNKFSSQANILFTEGIYLCSNNLDEIKKYQSLKLDGLKSDSYRDFLNQINIGKPKDTSGNHDITNKWSIYRWSGTLNISSDSIIKNNKQIENSLYFKYLIELNKKDFDYDIELKKTSKKGNVLLIDDEWDKGWSEILSAILVSKDINFNTFEYDYKDKSFGNFFYKKLEKKIKDFKPDVVILDLRLAQEDHENVDIENYTGIKILEKIHEINAGIQVVMLTATSKSTILEKLYEKKILGYIKKEHPEDKSINTIENINKFIGLIDEGLKRKNLKDIHITKIKILDLLNIDFTLDEDELDSEIFKKFSIKKENYLPNAIKLYKESENIFDILDSNKQNSFIYAMLSITSSLETLLGIFMDERQNTFWDGETFNESTVTRRHRELFFDKFGFPRQTQGNEYSKLDVSKMVKKRNDYLHTKQTPDIQFKEIVSWFNNLLKMIEIINNPPNLRNYTRGNINNLIDRYNN